MSFLSLGLSNHLINALAEFGYKKPYPIQQKAIPAILKRKDILGIAKTGSGKTASYVLPLLTNLIGKTELKNRHVNVLVLVPTRELAIQVREVFQQFSVKMPETIKSLAVYGGVSINPQMMALQNVNILVATPGRLLELVEKNAVNLSEIKTLVLDEADRMLHLVFKEEIDRVLKLLPVHRQNLLFSATLNENVNNISQILLDNPEVIKIEETVDKIDLIRQLAYSVEEDKKGPLLRHLIKVKRMKQVLIFTSSVHRADMVADKLLNHRIDAESIHSKKSQRARREALYDFKNGDLRVLVTTDLLARGIDIEFLPFVINYELPRSPKDFIHRIGRTGRAERPGDAISFVTEEAEHHFKVIQKKMGTRVKLIDSKDIDF